MRRKRRKERKCLSLKKLRRKKLEKQDLNSVGKVVLFRKKLQCAQQKAEAVHGCELVDVLELEKTENKENTNAHQVDLQVDERISTQYSQILLMSLQSSAVRIELDAFKKMIVESHADPSIVDTDGNSLLHWSVWNKNFELATFLLDDCCTKLNPRATNNLTQTALVCFVNSREIAS